MKENSDSDSSSSDEYIEADDLPGTWQKRVGIYEDERKSDCKLVKKQEEEIPKNNHIFELKFTLGHCKKMADELSILFGKMFQKDMSDAFDNFKKIGGNPQTQYVNMKQLIEGFNDFEWHLEPNNEMITNLTSYDLKDKGKLDYIEFSYAMANMAAFIIPGCENCLAKTVENINSFFNYIDCNQDKFVESFDIHKQILSILDYKPRKHFHTASTNDFIIKSDYYNPQNPKLQRHEFIHTVLQSLHESETLSNMDLQFIDLKPENQFDSKLENEKKGFDKKNSGSSDDSSDDSYDQSSDNDSSQILKASVFPKKVQESKTLKETIKKMQNDDKNQQNSDNPLKRASGIQDPTLENPIPLCPNPVDFVGIANQAAAAFAASAAASASAASSVSVSSSATAANAAGVSGSIAGAASVSGSATANIAGAASVSGSATANIAGAASGSKSTMNASSTSSSSKQSMTSSFQQGQQSQLGKTISEREELRDQGLLSSEELAILKADLEKNQIAQTQAKKAGIDDKNGERFDFNNLWSRDHDNIYQLDKKGRVIEKEEESSSDENNKSSDDEHDNDVEKWKVSTHVRRPQKDFYQIGDIVLGNLLIPNTDRLFN